MIDVKNLTKRYAGRTAVDNISFNVGQGEIVGFLGPNGAGKTTTLRMLTSYLPATEGTIKIADYDVFRQSIDARRHIGYMPENVPLYDDMRVKEYLQFRARLKGMRGRPMRQRVGEVMELCGVTDVRKKMIGNLSKGYRQRVGLADALVHSPKLLILDEPTNGLDPNQIRQVRQLIRQLGDSHTILLSTHILSEVEMTCQRIIIIHEGQIRAADTPSNLVQQLRTAGTIEVELKSVSPESVEKLKRIKGVRKVHQVEIPDPDWMHYSIRVESSADIREQVYNLAQDQKWTLRELSQTKASLEDVFVELTQRDGI